MEPQCAEARCRRVNEAPQSDEAQFVRRVLIVVAIGAAVLLLWELRQVVVLIVGIIVGVVWSVGSQVSAQSQNLAATLPRAAQIIDDRLAGMGLGHPLA